MVNEYNNEGQLIIRDTAGTQMSMYRFYQMSLLTDSVSTAHPGEPPGYYGGYSGHTGYDFPGDRGTEIRSTCAGEVVVYRGGIVQEGNPADWGGMGNSIIIKEEGAERYHRYMHMLSDPVPALNSRVEQGSLIGYIGSTGDSSGPHLHYDIQNALWGTTIDAWAQFDNSTQPAGWTPQFVGDALVSSVAPWSSIQDTGGIDFGPPGSSQTFFTTKHLYDVSTYQSPAEVSSILADSTTGGLIIRAGATHMSSPDDKAASHLAAAVAAGIPVGFYFACYNSVDSEGSLQNLVPVFTKCFNWLTAIGARTDSTYLGVWLDMESGFENSFSASKADNLATVELFNEMGVDAGYEVVGFYTNKSAGLEANFTLGGGIEAYPFWYSRPGASRATVDSELATWGFTKAYLWQDGYPGGGWSPDKTYIFTAVDNDTQLIPIPITGGGGGGGTQPVVGEVTVTGTIVPAKQLAFSPHPGVIPVGPITETRVFYIGILTDADAASIYYTVDGSEPGPGTFQYSGPIVRDRSTHVRAVAVDTAGTVVARGSGTFLLQRYDARAAKPVLDDLTPAKYEVEVDMRPHLQIHTSTDKREIHEYIPPTETILPEDESEE